MTFFYGEILWRVFHCCNVYTRFYNKSHQLQYVPAIFTFCRIYLNSLCLLGFYLILNRWYCKQNPKSPPHPTPSETSRINHLFISTGYLCIQTTICKFTWNSWKFGHISKYEINEAIKTHMFWKASRIGVSNSSPLVEKVSVCSRITNQIKSAHKQSFLYHCNIL